VFPPHLIDRYFSYFWPQLGLSRQEFLALGITMPAATGSI
jgi:starch phosphorylase